MLRFQICQYIKDSVACLVFFLFANMPRLLGDSEMLCLFFSLGAMIDCLFVSFRYYHTLPLTIASIKDVFGLFGMICFTIALVFLKQNHAEFWQKFFYLAFIIDYASILSVCSFSWNIYVNVMFTRLDNRCIAVEL
jgi:hypothetical protein